MSLDKCKPCEGKEKGAGGPRAVGPAERKSRRVDGPTGAALEALAQLFLVFLGDLETPEVSVEEAAKYASENINEYLRRYHG